MVRSGEDFLELVWSAREEGVIGRPNQCFACSGAPQGGMWSAQGCKVGTNREQGRGGKWGRDSSELTGTQTSIIREQLGVGSREEQGAGRGGKWGRGNSMGRMVANSLHSPAGSALTPQGGKWGRSGNAPGWKVGAPRGLALTPGHSAHARAQCLRARAQHSPTSRTQPHNNAHRRARPWLQVGHNPCTTRKDQTSTWGYFNDPRHSVRLVDHTSTRAHATITGAHIQRALSESRIPDPSKTQ